MVKIVAARHRFYFIEAQVIQISLLKRENNINKVFAKLYNIRKPGTRRKWDHWLCRMYPYITDLPVFIYQMVKKIYGMLAFTLQEIGKRFVQAWMYLVGIHKFLVAEGAGPHWVIFFEGKIQEKGESWKVKGERFLEYAHKKCVPYLTPERTTIVHILLYQLNPRSHVDGPKLF